MTDILIDGLLTDWEQSQRIDDGSVSDYEVYGTSDANDFIFAIKAPVAIGANTTAWFNTDRNAATGYEIFGFAGGAEYKVDFNASGVPALYTGDGLTLVASNLSYAYNADHTVVELRVAKAAVGNPMAMDTLYDVNDTTFLPSSYSNTPFTVYNDLGIVPAADTRIGIVFSQTTADNYFGATAYSDLFMAVQSQAMQAGVKFDILTESDLKDLATLAKYDALVFPSFRNVQASDASVIANTLQQAQQQFHLGIIAGGEFMTDDQNNNALPGNSYANMMTLLGATRVTGGNSATVAITATDASGHILDGYANGELVHQYTNIGWNGFAATNGTGVNLATETIDGQTSYAAALATETGGRNVLFSTEGVMADSNLLQDAIKYVVNGTGVGVALHMTRDTGILAARVDMDQSQELEDVNPSDGSPGIYDKLVPILTQWKHDFNFVGSYYVNIGDGNQGTGTDWTVSLPYYTAMINLGNEIGTHSYTHPENTNLLSDSELQHQFADSAAILSQKLTEALGYTYTIAGAAVPGAAETLATSQAILPYVNSYLTGGWTGVGSGYPSAFGFMTPGSTDKVYLAPNTVFDFTTVEFQHMTPDQASAVWAAEWGALTSHADSPIVVWPFHDYGAAAWDTTGTNAPSPYTTQMFTDYIARAASDGMEFVTLEDLAARMQAFQAATVTTSISGNVITATVTASNIGDFALDLTNEGGQVIQNVAGWYAYDSNSVFLPASGGSFTVTLGAAQDDVTHISSLPMRGALLSVTGDGSNLDFALSGEGLVVIDLTNPAGKTVAVTGASVVSQIGDLLTLDVGAQGLHNVHVAITAMNHPPVITSDGGGEMASISVAENLAAVTTVVATDADGTALTYALSGTDAGLFNLDAATGALSFKAAPNFEAPADAGGDNVYDVVLTASDGALTDPQALAITVTNVNEAPVITSNGGGDTAALSVAENAAAITTAVAVDPEGVAPLYSLSGADAALFNLDAATGALSFKAAPNFEAPADAGGNNVYDVIVTASDGTLTDAQALAIAVTNVNEAPVITSNGGGDTAALSVAENILAVTTVVAGDPDGTAPTYTLSGTDAARFNLNAATGALSFKAAPNFEGPTDTGGNNVYDLIVTASDGTLTDSQALAITVTNVNEAPIITSNGGGVAAAISVAENAVAVTTVTAVDPEGVAPAYSLSGGDAAAFNFDPVTGALTFKAAPNFEAPTDVGGNNVYDVVVTASDGILTDTQALAIRVTNVNEAPVITSNGGGATAAIAIAENTLAVATVAATDPDGTAMRYTVSGADAAMFAINSTTGALNFKAAPNFELPTDVGKNNIYDVVVTASDGVLTDTQALAITVINANDAPIITSNGGGATSNISFAENGTGAVTTVTATDADGNALAYSLGGTDASQFSIDPVTGMLKFIAAPDYEAPSDAGHNNVYNVSVTASDGLLTDSQAIAITVTNVAGVSTTLKSAGTLTGTVEADNLTGSSGADSLTGLGGSDTLSGAAGNDTIVGGNGNDMLVGGAGIDRITGGDGIDTFVFSTIADSRVGAALHDVILDFQAGTDLIDLSGIDANTGKGANQTFTFLAAPGAAFTGAGQLGYHYEFIGGTEYTVVQANVDGNLAPDFEVALLGHVALSSSMFVL